MQKLLAHAEALLLKGIAPAMRERQYFADPTLAQWPA
jgi:hypothetical protein